MSAHKDKFRVGYSEAYAKGHAKIDWGKGKITKPGTKPIKNEEKKNGKD